MLGVVILNYQNWDDTRQCIQSIDESTDTIQCRIYLVDNASPDAPQYEIEKLSRKYPVIYIKNENNLGYNGGNNVGISKALEDGCTGILIANNDVFFRTGCIEKLWNYLQKHPETGIVGPKIYDLQGNLQISNLCEKPGLKEKYLVCTRLNVIFRKKYRKYFGYDKDYDTSFPVYAVLGCCLMFSRSCAEAVTPFDEYPFLYEEELILGYHMQKTGYQTVYYPEAVIEHRHGGSTMHVKAFSYTQNIRSELYYCRQYLKTKKNTIKPLYWYRTLLYLVRCLRYEDFRRYWGEYCRTTKEELRKWTKT